MGPNRLRTASPTNGSPILIVFALCIVLLIALALAATMYSADSRKHDRPNWW